MECGEREGGMGGMQDRGEGEKDGVGYGGMEGGCGMWGKGGLV